MNVTFGLTVKQRIVAMLVGTTLLLLGLFGGALYALKTQLSNMEEMYTARVSPIQQLKEIADDFSSRIADTAYDKRNDLIGWSEGLKRVRAGREEIEAKWSFYTAGELDPRELALADKVDPAVEQAIDELEALEAIFTSEDRAALDTFVLTTLQQISAPVLSGLRELSTLQQQLARETYQRADASYQRFFWTMVTVIAVALIGLVLGAWALLNSIVEPLKRAEDYCRAIAGGDLYTTLDIDADDEIGHMIASLNRMSDDLAAVVDDVVAAAGSMGHGVREIAAGNLNLSERTEQQASSLEETAASMEQMTATVKQNADNARHANDLAADASRQAEQGVEIASVAMSAMGEINDASRKISDITTVVDEIAFQTNLLALNAAVEAARAGDAGRGFAVVATEVRVLAQRSAEAAKQIKSLIDDSVEKVNTGSNLVQQSSKALGDIVTAVRQVSAIMNEISASNIEQSEGIAQVNDAIAQMDQMTQQNAALVEQAAAAAKALEDEAARLDSRVAFFETRRSRGKTSTSTTAQPAIATRQRPAPGLAPTSMPRPAAGTSLPKPSTKPAPAPTIDDNAEEWQEF